MRGALSYDEKAVDIMAYTYKKRKLIERGRDKTTFSNIKRIDN